MRISKKLVTRHLRETFLIALIGFPFGWALCTGCWGDWNKLTIAGIFSSTVWVTLWKGNEGLGEYLNFKISWLERPVTRFTVGVLVMVIYTVGAVILINFVFNIIYGGGINTNYLTLRGLLNYGGTAVLVTTVIALFLHARAFLIDWRKTALNAEKLKSESIASQYETLKNQVNPHFLFNSLNVLTNLVYQDQDLAARFIKKLANVYRYVLETKDEETIPLDKELRFVDDYIFLQRIRFGESLKFDNQLPEGTDMKVAPLSIQILIENAIKHNVIEGKQPLYVKLSMEDGYISVSNNMQKKNVLNENNVKVGLSNIKARYEYLTDRGVEVLDDGNDFIVKLPVIR